MTVEELATAMEKDIGEPHNFIRRNWKCGIPGILFAVRLKQSRIKIRLAI